MNSARRPRAARDRGGSRVPSASVIHSVRITRTRRGNSVLMLILHALYLSACPAGGKLARATDSNATGKTFSVLLPFQNSGFCGQESLNSGGSRLPRAFS